MGGATTILGTLLGFVFGGPNGACAGAVGGWLIDAVIASIARHSVEGDAEKVAMAVEGVSQRLEAIERAQSETVERLPASREFYTAMLDAQHLHHADLLEAYSSDGDNEADIGEPPIDGRLLMRRAWSIIRRRLTGAYGLNPQWVDKARSPLMALWATGQPMPKTGFELRKILEDVHSREAQRQAAD